LIGIAELFLFDQKHFKSVAPKTSSGLNAKKTEKRTI